MNSVGNTTTAPAASSTLTSVFNGATASPHREARCAAPSPVEGLARAESVQHTAVAVDAAARPPIVLIGIEEEWGARSLDSLLAPNGFAVLHARTGAQAMEMARAVPPDAVILDWQLPDLDGVTVCQRLAESAHFNPATPILLTDTHGAGRRGGLAALAAGAWMFCPQPFDGEALLQQLKTLIRAKRESDQLHEESLMDRPSGLYSFRGLMRRARELGAETHRLQRALGCVVCSPVGYEQGLTSELETRLVAYFGDLFRRYGRLSDAIGRVAMLDFAVVAPSTDGPAAARLAHRLRELVELHPFTVGGTTRRLDVRAGYCAVPNFAKASLDSTELVTRAMIALRHAHSNIGGRAVSSSDDVPVPQR